MAVDQSQRYMITAVGTFAILLDIEKIFTAMVTATETTCVPAECLTLSSAKTKLFRKSLRFI